MATLTWKGATAQGGARGRARAPVPTWQRRGLRRRGAARARRSSRSAGCLNCHTYLGDGRSNLGAPDLTDDRREGRGVDSRSATCKPPQCGNPARRCRRSRRSATRTSRKLAIFLEASKGRSRRVRRARLPRDHRRVRRSLRRPAARGARRGRAARSASAPPRAGIEVLATELYGDARLSARRGARAFRRAEREAVTVYDRRTGGAPYASGSARVDAYVVCPCSMAHARDDRLGRDGEPDPSRRVGRAEGGPQARARAARDAALGDPPREHADAAPGGRGRSSSPRRASTTAPRRSTTSSTSSSAAASISWARERARPRWGRSDDETGTLAPERRRGRCSTGSRRSTT